MDQTIITLYTRAHCHLCETAKETILELKRNWDFILEEIDIDQSDDLTERYGLMIPVVLVDGNEVGFGYIDQFEVCKRLRQKNQAF
ncbi:MAG: glutaredoxin family protein [Bacillota bacterium]|nr:glutaredoxin family protein [Bacillota bacterium]